MAHGQHARGPSRRAAPTARQRRPGSHRRPPHSIHAALAGAAAVVAATVGGLSSGQAQAGAAAPTALVGTPVAALDAQLLKRREYQMRQERGTAHQRDVRASRERVRQALPAEGRQQARAAGKPADAPRRPAERARRLASSYVTPVVHYRLTARFGAASGLWSTAHSGLDFSAPAGTPVRAVAAGRVVSAEWAGAYGWQIIIRHADGTETWYCHLSSMTVRAGALQPGQGIGRVGRTGNTTGPHLHLEVRVGGKPIDPAGWLGARGVKL